MEVLIRYLHYNVMHWRKDKFELLKNLNHKRPYKLVLGSPYDLMQKVKAKRFDQWWRFPPTREWRLNLIYGYPKNSKQNSCPSHIPDNTLPPLPILHCNYNMELSLWGHVSCLCGDMSHSLPFAPLTAGDPPQWCEHSKGVIQISKGDIQTYFFQH